MPSPPLELALLHAVPLPAWAALLESHGHARAPRSLADVRVATREDPSLAPMVRTLRALCGEDARGALLTAARVFGVDSTAWPADVSTAELTATLLARATRDPAIADVIRAAELHLCRREPVAPKRRYVGTSRAHARPATSVAALRALAAIVARANLARHASGTVDVTIAHEDARSLVLDVVRPEPPVTHLARGARGVLSSKTSTHVTVDRVILERAPTRELRDESREREPWVLWIATSCPELLGAYRAGVGEALYDDSSVFATARPISLRAIQRSGRVALGKARASHARLRDARVVLILWDPGREETLTIAGRDVLAAVEREELPSHGLVLGARVRLDFDDHPVDVTLRSPNVVHWEPSPHDDAVRAFVDALDLDAPAHENLVTLAPHDHAGWFWRVAVGDDVVERLFARRMFVESTRRALGHPGLPTAGRIMLAFALGKSGKYYVVAEEGFDAEPWLATESDLSTYRLDLAKLAAEMQRELGTDRDAVFLERGTLVDLGAVTVGGALVRLYLVVAARAIDGLAERLRARSEGAQPILVVPPGMKLGTGCAEVEMSDLAGPYNGILAAAARAIGVLGTLDAWARAPKGTRLAVDRKSGRAWLDGVELVELAESARVLARVLVAAGGKPVAGAECDRKLSGARGGGGAAKKAKARFAGGVSKSFALAGREPPEDVDRIVAGTRSGYRVTVPSWIG